MTEKTEISKIELEPPGEETTHKIKNEQDLERRFGEFAKIGKKMVETELARERRIQKAKDSFKKKRENLKRRANQLFSIIMQFCEENREQILPEDRKSITLNPGTLGWRKGPATIELKVSEEEAIAYIKTKGLKKKYVRKKEKVDIEALLKNPEDAKKLRSILTYTEPRDFFFLHPSGMQTKFTQRMKAIAKAVTNALQRQKKK